MKFTLWIQTFLNTRKIYRGMGKGRIEAIRKSLKTTLMIANLGNV